MAMKAPKKRKSRPFWERGYRSHGYWLGKKKLGFIKLNYSAPPEYKYHWQADTHTGAAASLVDAKRAVESAVLLGISQLPLFEAIE